MQDHLELVISTFQRGHPVCLFDAENREGETDLLYPAQSTEPATIRKLRKDCGGLLFLAIGHEVADLFGFPYLQDLYTDSKLVEKYPLLQQMDTNDLQYDSRSAFTLSINHRDTFTGITDKDRALTTRRFAELFRETLNFEPAEARVALGQEFRTPGHIPVCRENALGLSGRQGHTELAVGLARLSGMIPVVIGAEMLQPDGDHALSVDESREWAKKQGIPFLTGKELMEALAIDGRLIVDVE